MMLVYARNSIIIVGTIPVPLLLRSVNSAKSYA